MSRTLRYVWAALGFLILGAGIQTGSAFAHEQRNFAGGKIVVHVGFLNEPAFEDEANGLDLFVNYDTNGDGQCNDNNGQSDTCLDWEPVDSVDVKAAVLYLAEDQFNAPIREQAPLKGELKRDFFDPTRFNIHFKPNVGGAYGFILNGTITKNQTVVATFTNEKFVCGNGHQPPTTHGFSCVGDILQPFPFGAQSNYRDDRGSRGKGSEPHETRDHKSAKKK